MRKRKGIVLAAWIAVFLFAGSSLAGCSAKENENADKAAKTKEEKETEPAKEENKADAKTDIDKTEEIDAKKLEKMLPVFDSFIRFHVQNAETLKYSASDRDYVWGALYGIIADYARIGENGIMPADDKSLKSVPDKVVTEYAQGLFAGLEKVPELTADIGQDILPDAVNHTYLFALRDEVENTSAIRDYKEDTDGSWIVNVSSHYPYAASSDTSAAVSTFRIVKNPYDGLFPYAVKEVMSVSVPENSSDADEQEEAQEMLEDDSAAAGGEDASAESGELQPSEHSESVSEPSDPVSGDEEDMSIPEYVEKYGEEKALEKYGEVPFNKYYLRPKEAKEAMDDAIDDSNNSGQSSEEVQ